MVKRTGKRSLADPSGRERESREEEETKAAAKSGRQKVRVSHRVIHVMFAVSDNETNCLCWMGNYPEEEEEENGRGTCYGKKWKR